MKTFLWFFLGLITLFLPGTAVGQAESPLRGPVSLKFPPNLRRYVSAFPRVQSNATVSAPIAARINASLRELDRVVLRAAIDCNKELLQNGQGRNDDSWERSVEVTMRGPFFLSILGSDSTYCGGPHPDEARFPMVYDLADGRPVNWLKMLPPEAKGTTDSTADGVGLGLVIWEPLQKLALAQTSDEECRDYFDLSQPREFAISLNGRDGTFIAIPYGLPHVIAACADDVEMPVEDAKRLGISPKITEALEASRKLQH